MKRIVFAILVLVLLGAIINVAFSIVSLWGKRDVLTQTQEKLQKEQAAYVQLRQQWGKIHDPNFVEEEARDKLFLSKPGESIVLIPPATPSGSVSTSVGANMPTWQQWLGLFF